MDRLSARDPRFAAALRQRVRGEVREGESLAGYSTYRIGGPATVLLPSGAEDVSAGLTLAAEAGVPWFAVGLGSNLLFPDDGLDALVVRIGKGLDGIRQEGDRWTLGAGLPAPLAARRTAKAGFAGLHVFVGVPGTVGGGVYMNAGCHGGDWAAVVEQVVVVDASGRHSTVGRDEISFTYRRSGVGHSVIVETTVRLRPEEQTHLDEEIAEMFQWRQRGTPFNQPCCGSVFQNPAGPSWKQQDCARTAGQLVEAAGLKGARIGGAQVSPMHANYIVNTGAASAADVTSLIQRVRAEVAARFDVELHPEVKVIGPAGEYVDLEPLAG